jgi:BolA family transcriptional regulator, general stress-responsive regulator
MFIGKFLHPPTGTLIQIRLSSTKPGPVCALIKETIEKSNLKPYHVELLNESYKHNGSKRGQETHLQLTVITHEFEAMPMVQRHRRLNDLLKDIVKQHKIHALSFVTPNPSLWYDSFRRGLKLDEQYRTPPCLGGRVKELSEQTEQLAQQRKVEKDSSKVE